MLILLDSNSNVLLEKRPSVGIWGGLWSLPESNEEDQLVMETEQRFQCQLSSANRLTSFRHTFSHYHLMIQPIVFAMGMTGAVAESTKYQWYSKEVALTLGLPAPVRQILEEVLSH